MRPCTDEEWETLPHVPLTQDNEWNPTSLDSVITDTDKWADAFKEIMKDERWDQNSDPFDEKGYHLDKIGKKKKHSRRHHEDANRTYSHKLEQAHQVDVDAHEIVETHAEDMATTNRLSPAARFPIHN